ncbi:DUF4139 domain-containing protein [Aquabacterium sp.]|uniref:DUF4139 domain-containing protein n=1 Tax=Aquabacterium sp. TaxID=1872578 RepID=UPI0037831867
MHHATPLALATAALLAALPGHAAPPAIAELRSTLDDQQALAVTIYNQDLALVKDTRRVALPAGGSRLAWRDVSAQMKPQTALLRGVSQPDAFQVLEQNFDFDLLTPAKLLEKSVGQTVRVVRTHPTTGAETVETARVLATSGGPVLQIGDRIETGIPGRIVFDQLPPQLRDRPTLVAELQARQPGTQTVELSYLSGGLSWQADYVAELDAGGGKLDLNGWITLTNRSGNTYPNAKLQLVAGDVNRVQEAFDGAVMKSRTLAVPAAAAPAVTQQSLFEYHLYTLARPTTIADNQTKQVALLQAAAVPVRRELLLAGQPYYYGNAAGEIGRRLKPGVFIEFANREEAGLGQPLPRGVVRVYQRDSEGRAQFIGEDRIDHSAKNETLRLKLGEAFDVTADRTQTDFKRRESTLKTGYAYESAYEIVLRNAKPEAVTVTVREPVPGDWKMLEESQRHTRVAAGTAQWLVSVPANGSTTLKYRVLTQY